MLPAFAAFLLATQELPAIPTPSPPPPAWEVLSGPAPEARFRRMAGGTTTLREHRGKVVVLDFWTTWCEPCVAELPALNVFHEWARNRGDIVFLSVNDDAHPADLARFLGARRPRFPVLLMDAANAFGIRAYPTKLVVDRDGSLRLRARGGPISFDELRRRAIGVAGSLTGAAPAGTIAVSVPPR
jgi:thiol-disulfide isomerase/thioredoxin